MIARKSSREIDTMRRAGRLVAEVLALVEDALEPGVTTRDLDHLAESHIRAARRAEPSAKLPATGPMAAMLKKLFGDKSG